MSIHNAVKYGTGIIRSYGNLVGVGDEEEGTSRLGETLTPTVPWELAELRFLRQEFPFTANANHAAGGAGFFGTLAVAPTPGLVTVVTAVEGSAGLNLLFDTGLFGTPFVPAATDSRAWLRTSPPNVGGRLSSRFAAQNGAGLPGTAFPFARFHAVGYNILKPAIVLVGTGSDALGNMPQLIVSATTSNSIIEISVWGYERPANPGELAG